MDEVREADEERDLGLPRGHYGRHPRGLRPLQEIGYGYLGGYAACFKLCRKGFFFSVTTLRRTALARYFVKARVALTAPLFPTVPLARPAPTGAMGATGSGEVELGSRGGSTA